MTFFYKKKIMLMFLILFFLGISGWFWRHREYIPFVSQPLSVAAAPFEYTVSRSAVLGSNTLSLFREVWDNWTELERLRRENENLRAEQAQYSEVLAENIRLKNLLQFKQTNKQYQLSGASVIAQDYSGWTHTVIIDRGEDSGIRKYMPVIVPTGLVGFVSEVYLNSSRVQLLFDPRTSVGGIVQRPSSRVVSMVSGTGSGAETLRFDGLPKESDVIKGDVIITSGYGGVYPKGLVIGTVEKVNVDALGGVEEAEIKPAADFAHMEEVFVIMDSIQQVKPESTLSQSPKVEPPMDPNKKQAGENR